MFNHAKLGEIEYKSPVHSSALCNNILVFVRILIFLSTSFKKKQVSKPSEPFERLVVGCGQLRVAMQRIIS